MSLYSEIAAFGGAEGAVYIGARSLSKLAAGSLETALSQSVGQIVELAVKPYAVRFDSAKGGTSGTDITRVNLGFGTRASDLVLSAAETIVMNFSFGVLDQGVIGGTLSTLTLTLRDLAFTIDVQSGKLACSEGEGHIEPKLSRDDNIFNAIIAQYGLDTDTATRVEGMLLYSGLATAISKTLTMPHAIDLVRLFPGIQFDGTITIAMSSDRQFLLLKGAQGISPRLGSACDCADVGNGIGPLKGGSGQAEANATPPAPVGGITVGGPTPVNPADALQGQHRYRGQGDSGVFLPVAKAQALVSGPYPAVRVDISDNGFIGWKAAGIVDFKDFKFEPDPAYGRFYVELSFRVEVYGSIHVDLGKLGKVRVTSFSAEQKGAGVNSVRVGFYLVVGTQGLYLKPVLEDFSFGDFDVFLRLGTLIGTPFGGWGAVIGFIFDVILAEIIASQIPTHLDLELRRYMAKVMFPLLEASYAAELAGIRRLPLGAMYDGGLEGFLFSIGDAG